jgi:hypothetical protein
MTDERRAEERPAKVLILGNFELSLELGEGKGASESEIRARERRILRFLKKLAEEDSSVKGTVESLEFESFTYGRLDGGEPNGYYYNKYSAEENPKPGSI